jgi:sugar/nucleoside kinase (ribokinase family)
MFLLFQVDTACTASRRAKRFMEPALFCFSADFCLDMREQSRYRRGKCSAREASVAAESQYDYASIGFYTFDCLGWPFTAVPPGGGCYFIDELTLAVSGAAGTAAIAAAKMGLKTLAVGGVGEDLMGEWVMQRLRHFGVDVALMQHKPGWKTSSSIVTTRADGSRPALHMKGATGTFTIERKDFDTVASAKVVHLGGVGLMDAIDGAPNAALMRHAKERGCITTVDVFAGSSDDLPDVDAVLPYTDYFMPSIEEARALSGIEDLVDCTKFFHDRGVACCVFTLGEHGAYYSHTNGTRFTIPAFDIAVKCSCGCGDAFDAGYAVAICHGFDPETSVRFAQATSALNASGLGSQAGVESFEKTWNFMKTTKMKAR